MLVLFLEPCLDAGKRRVHEGNPILHRARSRYVVCLGQFTHNLFFGLFGL
jgi:hypothetical protein